MDDAFTLSLTPTRTRTDARGRGQLDVRADLIPAAGLQTSFKLSYEIATPSGTIVSKAASPALAVAADRLGRTASFSTPADLADGHYVVRAVAAGSNSRGTNSQLVEQYLQIDRGLITVLTFQEWSERSGINVAHIVLSDVQPKTEAEARERFAAKPTTTPTAP